MQKIRYRLVYNRKNQLNHQGTALVQVEAKLNLRRGVGRNPKQLRNQQAAGRGW